MILPFREGFIFTKHRIEKKNDEKFPNSQYNLLKRKSRMIATKSWSYLLNIETFTLFIFHSKCCNHPRLTKLGALAIEP